MGMLPRFFPEPVLLCFLPACSAIPSDSGSLLCLQSASYMMAYSECPSMKHGEQVGGGDVIPDVGVGS